MLGVVASLFPPIELTMDCSIFKPVRRVLASLCLLILLVSPIGGAERSSGPTSHDVISASQERLRQIENDVLPQGLQSGPPRHTEIVDYYGEANAALRDRLSKGRGVFASGKGLPFREMTVVAGAAGIGKTFIKGHIYKDIPRDQVLKFDIREWFEELAEGGLALPTPDLELGDRVFNHLLRLTPAGRTAFTERLNDGLAPFVVADSLDEVHPDDYRFVLEQLERLVVASDQPFIHVVVFGRPLAFRDHCHDRQTWSTTAISSSPGQKRYILRKPTFRTTGDLDVSNWNFDCWKHGLCRDQSSTGDSLTKAPMPLADYQRWCVQGYRVEGEFADVWFKPNSHMNQNTRQMWVDSAMRRPIVTSVLTNLAANGIAREILAGFASSGDDFDQDRFMIEFLGRWLERDTASDGRPSRIKRIHLESYLQLLEQVALKYASEERIDSQGYFDVHPSDGVMIEDHGEMLAVPVCQILDRSGLVTVDPQKPTSQRFRFEPFWFHRLLVDMHQRRVTAPDAISLATKPAG